MKKKKNNRVLDPNGREIHIKDFAGVVKGKNGKIHFLKGDICSLTSYIEKGIL